jgi:hypothetical protein
MYTDSDILDLYEDLQTVGLAETPSEQMERIKGYLVEAKSLQQASDILTGKGISHTFYSYKKQVKIKISPEFPNVLSDGQSTTNWIMVKGFSIYFDHGDTFCSVVWGEVTLESLKYELGGRLISIDNFTDIKDLPTPGVEKLETNWSPPDQIDKPTIMNTYAWI